jgi:hypothetical protein
VNHRRGSLSPITVSVHTGTYLLPAGCWFYLPKAPAKGTRACCQVRTALVLTVHGLPLRPAWQATTAGNSSFWSTVSPFVNSASSGRKPTWLIPIYSPAWRQQSSPHAVWLHHAQCPLTGTSLTRILPGASCEAVSMDKMNRPWSYKGCKHRTKQLENHIKRLDPVPNSARAPKWRHITESRPQDISDAVMMNGIERKEMGRKAEPMHDK